MDWPVAQILTHEDDATSRMTSQYLESGKLLALVRKDAERWQIVENAIYSVMTNKWIDEAGTDALDRIGEVIGEDRLGKNNDDYREAIRVRIAINQGGGDMETIYTWASLTFGDVTMKIEQVYPHKIILYANVLSFTQENLNQLNKIVTGGTKAFLEESNNELPLGFIEYGDGVPGNIGTFLEYANPASTDGAIVELYS